MQDKEVFIPIFEQNHFKPFKTTLSWIYKGTGALPHFDTIEECGDWCKDSNSRCYERINITKKIRQLHK